MYTTVNFYDTSVWRSILLTSVLLLSLLAANIIKRRVPFFKNSLIPNSVLGGLLLLIASGICYLVKGDYLFNLDLFSKDGSGINILETLTYHCLAIGFIAMTLRPVGKGSRKDRTREILNSGVSTICTYLLQGIFGIGVTLAAAKILKGFASGSGILLSFGYGQGTGQALNIGKNFDKTLGTSSYASFGLAMAALGFLTASIVGVIYLNYLRRKHKIDPAKESRGADLSADLVQTKDELPMNESVDKLSLQAALVALSYLLAYGMMYLLGNVVLGEGTSLIGTIYGFNFIFGVLAAVIVKGVLNFFRKRDIIHHEYTNTFLMNRISGAAFDIMIVSGICAIQLHVLSGYWLVILLLGIIGAAVTFFYLRFVSKKLFPAYEHEQFLAFFGMLTGTASTGMILLREADPDLKTPVSENLVYQNFPAIILGLPVLLIAGNLTANAGNISNTLLMWGLIILAFIVLNLFLFRSLIFKKKK